MNKILKYLLLIIIGIILYLLSNNYNSFSVGANTFRIQLSAQGEAARDDGEKLDFEFTEENIIQRYDQLDEANFQLIRLQRAHPEYYTGDIIELNNDGNEITSVRGELLDLDMPILTGGGAAGPDGPTHLTGGTTADESLIPDGNCTICQNPISGASDEPLIPSSPDDVSPICRSLSCTVLNSLIINTEWIVRQENNREHWNGYNWYYIRLINITNGMGIELPFGHEQMIATLDPWTPEGAPTVQGIEPYMYGSIPCTVGAPSGVHGSRVAIICSWPNGNSIPIPFVILISLI